jgi:amidase
MPEPAPARLHRTPRGAARAVAPALALLLALSIAIPLAAQPGSAPPARPHAAPANASTAPTAVAVGPVEAATRDALARIAQIDPKLHSILAVDPAALEEARRLDRQRSVPGPLHGLSFVVKDNIETRGPLPTTAGSLALRDNVSDRDAPVVARLRASGAVLVGKANLSEWAYFRSSQGLSGWSAVGGQTRNPHALDRNPCGSSSGSAVAVAAGLVDAALGTETDGSVTCPASVNGVVGLKPTVGLLSRHRIVPLALSQDTAGPMARDVATVARMLTAMAASDPADPATAEADARRQDYAAGLQGASLRGVRMGVLRFELGWSPAVDAGFERSLALLREQGAELVEITEGPDLSAMGDASFQVLLGEFRPQLDAYLAATPQAVRTRSLEALIAFNRANAGQQMPLFGQELFEQALAAPGPETEAFREARATALRLADTEGISHLLHEHRVEALLLPTAPVGWKIDAVNGDQTPFGRAGSMAAVAGTPHLTVPATQHWGLPLGLSFLGPRWGEARLLQLGAAFERARGPLPAPAFAPSIEAGPVVAPMLRPAGR